MDPAENAPLKPEFVTEEESTFWKECVVAGIHANFDHPQSYADGCVIALRIRNKWLWELKRRAGKINS